MYAKLVATVLSKPLAVSTYLNGLDPHDEPANVADGLGEDGEGEDEGLQQVLPPAPPLHAQQHDIHAEARCTFKHTHTLQMCCTQIGKTIFILNNCAVLSERQFKEL